MATEIEVTSPYNSTCPEGYVMLYEIKIDCINKSANIEFAKWENELTRKTKGKRFLGIAQIRTGEKETFEKESEEDTNGILRTIKYDDIKTEIEALQTKLYEIAKTQQIEFPDEVVNLANSKDVI